jgi:hypothetical protein
MFATKQTEPLHEFWQIGKPYLIRTVTMIDTGTLVAVTEHEIILRDASWIADTGRFSQALESCEYFEVEPFPAGMVAIGRGSVIEALQIAKVPRAVK